jgi:site-specific DNA recombinase
VIDTFSKYKEVTMAKRAILYSRVSTAEQLDNTSLEGQLIRMRQYAKNKGYNVVREVEEQHSGADPNRPGLNIVRTMARNDQADVAVFYTLDRFMRDATQAAIVQSELEKAGLEVEYMSLPDKDMPGYSLMLAVSRAMAEEERKTIIERTQRGKVDKMRRGNVMTHRMAPFGYREVEDDEGKRTFEIIEDEARIIRLIFKWYTIGEGENGPLSMRAIRKRLTEMRVPTYADRRQKAQAKKTKHGYGFWHHSVVSSYLRNETYAGTWRHESSGITVEVPAIVDRETWEIAQQRRSNNRKFARRNSKGRHLLRGRVTCHHCGYGMSSMTHAARNGRRRRDHYKCQSVPKDIPCEGIQHVKAKPVDVAVWAWIRDEVLADPDATLMGLEEQRVAQEEALKPVRAQLDATLDLIAQRERELERLLELFLTETFDLAVLEDKKHSLEKQLLNLRGKKAELETYLSEQALSPEAVQDIAEFTRAVKRGLDAAEKNFEKRRRIVDILNVRCEIETIGPKKVKVHAHCMLSDRICVVPLRRGPEILFW